MQPSPQPRLSTFFLATFAWSWFFFALALPSLRREGLSDASPWALAALLVGSYGPSLMAVALTGRAGGRAAIRELLAGFTRWRGNGRRLLLALLLPSLLSLAALGLFAILKPQALSLSPARFALIPLALLAAVPFGPLAEELGWRGFAQPRLLQKYSPLTTGLLLGLAWTLWHIPLFFAPAGTSISGQPITLSAVAYFLALLTGLSILIVALSLPRGTYLLTGLLLHIGFNADIHRFLFEIADESRTAIERWTLIPICFLIGGLILSGRLKTASPISRS